MRAHVTRDSLVVVERVAVIRLQQVEVDVAERVGGDRLTRLDEPVRLQLVVREQHLRVEGADDAVDGVLEQHDAFARDRWRGRA